MAKENREKDKQKPPKEGKRITVSEEGLKALIEKAEKVDEVMDRLQRLEETGDVGRLDAFDKKHSKGIGPRKYRLSTLRGKVITGWRTVKDSSWQDPVSQRTVVVQEYEVLLEDNTKQEVKGYNNFMDLIFADQITAEEVQRTQEESGAITLKLKVIEPNHELYGKEYLIDISFVN